MSPSSMSSSSSSSTTTTSTATATAITIITQFPIEVLARVFPLLRDDPRSWYNLARCNKQLRSISKSLPPPRKWPDLLVDWERTEPDIDYYVDQVKYNLLNNDSCCRHIALMLRVYDGPEATDHRRVIRMLDIDKNDADADGENESRGRDGGQRLCRPIQDIPVGRSVPFTAFWGPHFVAVEPRRIRVYEFFSRQRDDDDDPQPRQRRRQYRLVRELPTAELIVGIHVFGGSDHHNQATTTTTRRPKIAIQLEDDAAVAVSLSVWDLLDGRLEYVIPYTGSANFCISDEGHHTNHRVVFACIGGGPEGRSVTTIYMDNNNNERYDDPAAESAAQNNNHHHHHPTATTTSSYRTYVLDLPGRPRRSWIDACKFSPDGRRLAVLTEERIFQLDTSREPPEWMMTATTTMMDNDTNDDENNNHHNQQIDCCCFVAPDGCTFSGQMQYTPDSKRFLAHARTPWESIYRGGAAAVEDNLNTVQVWNVAAAANNTDTDSTDNNDYHHHELIATKGFHDLVGSVGLSPDGKFVLVIQGDETDIFRSAIARIHTRYIAAMDDHIPYPVTGDTRGDEEILILAENDDNNNGSAEMMVARNV